MATPNVPFVTPKSAITSGATMPSSRMSMPSHTRMSMQTKTVTHWNVRMGTRDAPR